MSPAFEKPRLHGTVYLVAPGEDFTAAQLTLHNNSSQDAILERVDPVIGVPGVEVLGAQVGGPDRRLLASFDRVAGYPPDDERLHPLHPVAGHAISPSDSKLGTLILVGLRLDDGVDRATLLGFDITYIHDGTRYRERFLSTLAVCPEDSFDVSDCLLEWPE